MNINELKITNHRIKHYIQEPAILTLVTAE